MTKTCRNIREKTSVVLDTKISRIPVKISKDKNMFVVHIDGDMLDSYKTQKEAEKMAKEFVKQYKG